MLSTSGELVVQHFRRTWKSATTRESWTSMVRASLIISRCDPRIWKMMVIGDRSPERSPLRRLIIRRLDVRDHYDPSRVIDPEAEQESIDQDV